MGSQALAVETARFLCHFIASRRCPNAARLVLVLKKEVAAELTKAQPMEFVIGNVLRRVLHLVREEYRTISRGTPDATRGGVSLKASLHRSNTSMESAQTLDVMTGGIFPASVDSSMYNLLANPNHEPAFDYSTDLYELLQTVPQGIQELLEEIDASRQNIAAQALEHIHSNECIMTLGRSSTVEAFLLAAARKRQFTVIVAEGAPSLHGHQLAKTLSSHGLETLLIPDSAIFAMMARVNKVIIGCHAGIRKIF